MNEIILNINWLAVVVGAIVSYLLGWLWYSPKMFGTKWMEGVGVSCDDPSAPPPVAPMVTQAIGTFLLAWVVGVTATHTALTTIILITATFIFLLAAAGMFAQKSCYAIGVEVAYIIAMVVIMIVCQAIL